MNRRLAPAAALAVGALVVGVATAVMIRDGRSTPVPPAAGASAVVTSASIEPSPTPACASSPGQYDSWDGVVPSDAPSHASLVPTTGVVRPKPSTKPVPLVVVGRVVDRDCRPVPGAFVSAFHRDPDGNYGPDVSPPDDNLFYYQAIVRTDDTGGFELTTVRPSAPGAHIHVLVERPGEHTRLSLEIWFADDPGLPPSTSQEVVAQPKPRTDGGYEIDVALVFDPPLTP